MKHDEADQQMLDNRQHLGTAAAAWAVAGCFAALTVGKLVSPDPTLLVLRGTWQMPSALADAGFVALIAAEAVVIALLMYRPWRVAGFLLAAAFLLVVSASPARQLVEGSTAGCGCGGAAKVAATPIDHALTLGRNGLLFMLTIFGLWQLAARHVWASRLPGLSPLPTSLLRRHPCPKPVSGDAATSAASSS